MIRRDLLQFTYRILMAGFLSRKGMEPGKVDSSRRWNAFDHVPYTTYVAKGQARRISVPKDRTIKL